MLRLVLFLPLAGLAAAPAVAQSAPQSSVRSIMFRPAELAAPAFDSAEAVTVRPVEPGKPRLRNALIGGVIGAAAGAAVCTVISNIADDAAEPRFTTCTAKGYLLTGGIGFALGFGVGWMI